MKILFISSGKSGIYQWFESCLQTELSNMHTIEFIQLDKGILEFQFLIEKIKPNCVLTWFDLPPQMFQWLKLRGIKTAVWLTEDPYYMDFTSSLVNYYDYVFTIDLAAREFYQKKGHKQAHDLPLATSPNVFKPIKVEEMYKSDICLVGYPYPERIKFIQLLLQYTSFKILAVGPWNRRMLRKYRGIKNLTIESNWVVPSIAAKYYNGAKIVLNTHRPANLIHNKNKIGIIGKSINNRTFDVAACAAFQLIEFKEDLPKHFIEHEEIVSFNNETELIEMVNYFITADDERKRIASKARERVLKEHTFCHRMDKLISIVEGYAK